MQKTFVENCYNILYLNSLIFYQYFYFRQFCDAEKIEKQDKSI